MGDASLCRKKWGTPSPPRPRPTAPLFVRQLGVSCRRQIIAATQRDDRFSAFRPVTATPTGVNRRCSFSLYSTKHRLNFYDEARSYVERFSVYADSVSVRSSVIVWPVRQLWMQYDSFFYKDAVRYYGTSSLRSFSAVSSATTTTSVSYSPSNRRYERIWAHCT